MAILEETDGTAAEQLDSTFLPDRRLGSPSLPVHGPLDNSIPALQSDLQRSPSNTASFQRSPSLKDRLQQAVARKSGHLLPIADRRADHPHVDLSQRLQAIVGKHEGERPQLDGVGRMSFVRAGSKDRASREESDGLRASHEVKSFSEEDPEKRTSPNGTRLLGNFERGRSSSKLRETLARDVDEMVAREHTERSTDEPDAKNVSKEAARLTDEDYEELRQEQERMTARIGNLPQFGPAAGLQRGLSMSDQAPSSIQMETDGEPGKAVWGAHLKFPAGDDTAEAQPQGGFANGSNLAGLNHSGEDGEEAAAFNLRPAARGPNGASNAAAVKGPVLDRAGRGAHVDEGGWGAHAGSKAQIVDLSSDSSGDEADLVVTDHGAQGGFHWEGKKRQLPNWAASGRPPKRRPFLAPNANLASANHRLGGLDFSKERNSGGEFKRLRTSSPDSDGDTGSSNPSHNGARRLPDWSSKRGPSELSQGGKGVSATWPVAKPGSLEALRGQQTAPLTQRWASEGGYGGGFPRLRSDEEKEAAKRALAGPLREAALAHSGQAASLQAQIQQQALEHQRQQQAHFQRRILPPTMHTHTLSAAPSAPRDNDVALRGVLEGMAVSGPTEEADAPEGSMMVPLLKHQRLALSWMKKRESGTISNQPVGGILADDQGLGKTITTIALIMSNKAPPRLNQKELLPSDRSSPVPAETVDLDDYKEVFTSAAEDDDDDELMEIPPESVQLRLEYRPGGGSQQNSGDIRADLSNDGRADRGLGDMNGGSVATEGVSGRVGDAGGGSETGAAEGGAEALQAPVGGFLQDANWGGVNAAGVPIPSEGHSDWGGLRMHNGVLENAAGGGSRETSEDNGDAPLIKLKRKRVKKAEGASQKETSSGGPPRDPLSRRGRPPAGTLVVCPTSVLRQWASEVRDKVAPGEKLRLLIYHGTSRTKDPYELAQYDIVLTTYAIVSMEVPKQPLPESEGGASNGLEKVKEKPPKGKGKKKAKPLGEDEGLLPPGSGPLARVAWFRVVLDEAQSIKNARTQSARAAWSLRAKRRWCLSGTPIQNSIDDLYSYFRFLRFAPYDVFKSFRSLIREPIARNPTIGYRRLQVILSMIMMRRTKQTKIEGRPIIDLPARVVGLSQADFTSEERQFYDTLERESRQKFNAFRSAGTLNKNYVNILWMLLRLRQACNHWSLVKGMEGGDHHASKEAEAVARKLQPEHRAALLAAAESLQSPCSLCQDAPEEAVITKCCHVFCRQCIAEQVNNTDNLEPYACPVCKSPVTAKDVFSPATLRKLVTGSDASASGSLSADAFGQQPAVRSSSKINAMMRILTELPKRQVSVSTETGEIVGDHKGGLAGEGSPEDGAGVYPVETTEKAIIFSQWTSMLDLLEGPLQSGGFQYRRLDGTMTVQARDRAINDFTKRPEVTVMIMSLKAASLGLNLVAASHVLLLDVWWNPTTEDQAIDRAHRIGQTRTVNVSRLAVRATIEDRILALQEKKRQIVASAFGEQEGGATSRLSMEDISFLFQGG